MLKTNKSNPNYYPLVASVDSSSIESACIFPETLNKMHKRMCGKLKQENRKTTNMQTNPPPKMNSPTKT